MSWCIISVLFAISIHGVKSQSDCRTPHDVAGRCVSIDDCPLLLKLINRHTLSSESVNFLKKSHCGFTGDNKPRVCCSEPPSCKTQGGRAGTCIDIRSCPVMVSILEGPQPIPPDGIEYIRRSACTGLVSHAICCGDPSYNTCGNSGIEERIFGGEEAPIDALPWLALIEYEPLRSGFQNQLKCGAALIHPRFVLTAAHCLVDRRGPMKAVNVRLGEHDTNTAVDCQLTNGGFKRCNNPIVTIPIEKFMVHENFLPSATNLVNDIAIIRLAEAAPYTDYIRHICLPINDIPKVASSHALNFTIGGWGRTDNTSSTSNVKMLAEVPFKSLADCRSAYKRVLGKPLELTTSHMCAGEPGRDSCEGDSGGPLMWRNTTTSAYEVYGIVSFGTRVCGGHAPGIYTKVYGYVDWIMTQMRS